MVEEALLEGLEEELKCSICLSLLSLPIARLTGCCHSFCRSCITKAFETESKCPLCKHPASRRDIVRLLCRDLYLEGAVAYVLQQSSAGVYRSQSCGNAQGAIAQKLPLPQTSCLLEDKENLPGAVPTNANAGVVKTSGGKLRMPRGMRRPCPGVETREEGAQVLADMPEQSAAASFPLTIQDSRAGCSPPKSNIPDDVLCVQHPELASDSLSHEGETKTLLGSRNQVPDKHGKTQPSPVDAELGTSIEDAARLCSKEGEDTPKEDADLPLKRTDKQDNGRAIKRAGPQPQGFKRKRNGRSQDRQSSDTLRGMKSKWVLLGSGLSKKEKAELSLLQKLSGTPQIACFDNSVTHVICGSNDENLGRRTMKFMLGVLHGKWIVRTSWVSDCLRAQSPASEKSHEVVSDTRGKSSGPILGRMHAGLKLLRNWEIYIYDPGKKDKTLRPLVVAAGAKVLSRAPPKSNPVKASAQHNLEADPHSIVVVAKPEGDKSAFKAPQGWGGICLNADWLIDSASNYCVQPFGDYLL